MADVTVMHVINSLDIGGTEKQLYLLLKHLDRQRFRPLVVCLSRGGFWVRPIRNLGIEVIELERRGSYELKRLLTLVNLIRRRKPAVIHTWQSPGNLYGGLAALLMRHNRLVLSRRSIDEHRGMRGVADAVVHRRSSAVVCNSRRLADDLRGRFDGTLNCVVIYNGIESREPLSRASGAETKASLGLPHNCEVIGTVGRLVAFKNQRLLIDVACRIRRSRPDCYFVLAGDGPLRSELEDYTRVRNVSDRVVFLGFRADIPELLSAFDLFLFPSVTDAPDGAVFGEGFPNAVMEAMMAGIPCVASTESGAAELFGDGEAGFLIDPTDTDLAAERILTLLDDPDLREMMSARGRAIIQERFSVEPMANRFARLYDALIDLPETLSSTTNAPT